MKTSSLLPLLSCLALLGCRSSVVSRSFVGVATNPADWPYRYRISETDGKWSRTVEFHVPDGWIPWDKMQITEQTEHGISFKALLGQPGKAISVGWQISLAETSDRELSGRLTGDAFDSRFVELEFTPSDAEPDGAGNSHRAGE